MVEPVWRRLRQVTTSVAVLALLLLTHSAASAVVVVNGIAAAGANNSVTSDGSMSVVTGATSQLRIYGTNLRNATVVGWSTVPGSCVDTVQSIDVYGGTDNVLDVTVPPFTVVASYYICVDHIPQGTEPWFRLVVEVPEKDALPKWLTGCLVAALLPLSGLFAGLTLALMAIDTTTLKLIMKSGTSKEQKYAKKVYPLRKRGNLLLCTLVLGNVLVNNTLTILMDALTGTGAAAIVISTLAIMLVGEILPQSIACRYGLAMGAKSIYIVYLFMFLLFPLAFPIAKLMDLLLEREIGVMYTREQLKELLVLTGKDVNIDNQEIDIVTGALEFSLKTVDQVMTKMDDVFMIDLSSRLDFATMTRIVKSGHSRIPVYDGQRTKIVGLLFLRDLAFVDPDDALSLSTVLSFYNHPIHRVFDDTKLDDMLNEFRRGGCHLAVVQRVNAQGECDPFYEPLGVVTLEDVLEEIIKCEIVDETDVYVSNSTRDLVIRAPSAQAHMDFRLFDDDPHNLPSVITNALRVAILSFLTSSVPAFHGSIMAKNVVKRLIDHGIYRVFNGETDAGNSSKCVNDEGEGRVLYSMGEKSSVFTLILQGTVYVRTATDNLEFEIHPFQSLGIQALTDPNYVPSFTARVVGPAIVLQITREQYILASNATQLARSPAMSVNDLTAYEAEKTCTKSGICESALPLDNDTLSISTARSAPSPPISGANVTHLPPTFDLTIVAVPEEDQDDQRPVSV